jgi:hypothetical protein
MWHLKIKTMDSVKLLTTLMVTLTFTIMVYGQNWTNIEGGPDADYGGGIVLDGQKNIYISGTFYGAFDTTNINGLGIAKFDKSGNLQWAWQPQYYGYGTAYNNDVAVDSKDNVYVIGYTQDTVKIGDSIYTPAQPNSWEEFIIVKLNGNKNVIWARRAQGFDTVCWGVTTSTGKQIEINLNDNIYVSIELFGDMELGGDTVYSFCSTQKVIAKLDTTGNVIWIQNGGDHFTVDQNDNYYVSNNKSLTKYNDSGVVQWTRTLLDSICTFQINDWDFFYVATLDTLYRLKAIDGLSIWTAPIHADIRQTISSDSVGNVMVSGHKFPLTPPPYYIGTYNEYFDSTGTVVGYFYWGNPVTIHNTSPDDISLMNDGFLYMLGEVAVTSTFPNTSSFIYGTDTLPNISNFDIFVSKIKISDWLIPTVIAEFPDYNFDFRAYPNPFADKLVVEVNIDSTPPPTLTLLDIAGRQIYQTQINNKRTEFHLGKLSAGIYLLNLCMPDRNVTKKIIK